MEYTHEWSLELLSTNKDMMLDMLKLQNNVFESSWTEIHLAENNSDVVPILANKKQRKWNTWVHHTLY